VAPPRMIIVAGPPGSGKSSRIPITSFGVESFNADNRAAELNSGSFRKISNDIRARVNIEFQQWIVDHIEARRSFALETTLRSPSTFEQSRAARKHGFWTSMHYVAPGSVQESIRRIMERSYRGGHSASERLVREIYSKSMRNLLTALITALNFAESAIETVRVYDNSEVGGQVRRLLAFRRGPPACACKRNSGVAGIALPRNRVRCRRSANSGVSQKPRLILSGPSY
jgi:predicted ABC-type ATPase